MIAGHNLADSVHAGDFANAGWIWSFLHEPKLLSLSPQMKLYVLYPLIPWVGVMAAGFVVGPQFERPMVDRRRFFFWLGAMVTVGFVALRLSNVYGDPAPWAAQATALSTALSVLNVEKYPPSLLYLMMTLGPGLMLLAAFETATGRLAAWVETFGRVPLFYYVAHVVLIHALAVAVAQAMLGDSAWLIGGAPGNKPAGWGFSLPVVYGVWMLVVLTLYPICRLFADLKRRRREWWWSYL